jgi:arginine decarboxylase
MLLQFRFTVPLSTLWDPLRCAHEINAWRKCFGPVRHPPNAIDSTGNLLNNPNSIATEATSKLGKNMVPKKIFFTKGVGKHKDRLTSFELALRDAGIASQNLVRVSSIFPPQCKVSPRKQGLTYLSDGEAVFAVIAENSTREPHRLIASSIGVAIPADHNTYGYLSEHHSFGETEDQAGEYAEELAAEMLATTLNLEFDSDKSWDEKKEIYRISNKIVRTSNITQSAVGDRRGKWTTAIAAAVLILET